MCSGLLFFLVYSLFKSFLADLLWAAFGIIELITWTGLPCEIRKTEHAFQLNPVMENSVFLRSLTDGKYSLGGLQEGCVALGKCFGQY